jgi:hypothetical protein
MLYIFFLQGEYPYVPNQHVHRPPHLPHVSIFFFLPIPRQLLLFLFISFLENLKSFIFHVKKNIQADFVF